MVYVEWLDAVSNSEWISFEDAHNHTPDACISIGFLVRETDHDIIVAGTISESEYSDAICIPKPWIKHRLELSK